MGFPFFKYLQYASRKSDLQPINEQSHLETGICLTGRLRDEGHALGIGGTKEDTVIEVEQDGGDEEVDTYPEKTVGGDHGNLFVGIRYILDESCQAKVLDPYISG